MARRARRRSSHRTAHRLLVAPLAVAAGLAVGLVGCGEEPEDALPTIPSIDMTPVLVLSLDGGQVIAEDGPSERAPASLDPPTVAGGSVLEVRNQGDDPARLRAAGAFDTGVLEPGERTVVVVVNDGSEDRRLPLDDGEQATPPDGDDGPLGTLVVTPRPSS